MPELSTAYYPQGANLFSISTVSSSTMLSALGATLHLIFTTALGLYFPLLWTREDTKLSQGYQLPSMEPGGKLVLLPCDPFLVATLGMKHLSSSSTLHLWHSTMASGGPKLMLQALFSKAPTLAALSMAIYNFLG